jgi:hypothetical protein
MSQAATPLIPPNDLPAQANKVYTCPLCSGTKKRFQVYRNFKRHGDEICSQTRMWICPQECCSNRFYRAEKFRNHHLQEHSCDSNASAEARECTHADDALDQTFRGRRVLACGFCGQVFTTASQRPFVQHVMAEYDDGKTTSEWSQATRLSGLLRESLILAVWRELHQQASSLSTQNLLSHAGNDSRFQVCIDTLERARDNESVRRVLMDLVELSNTRPYTSGPAEPQALNTSATESSCQFDYPFQHVNHFQAADYHAGIGSDEGPRNALPHGEIGRPSSTTSLLPPRPVWSTGSYTGSAFPGAPSPSLDHYTSSPYSTEEEEYYSDRQRSISYRRIPQTQAPYQPGSEMVRSDVLDGADCDNESGMGV